MDFQTAKRSPAPQTNGVWVVVPAFNEGPRLGATLGALRRTYENIVVVDDGSRDATSAIAAEHRVWRLQHMFNCGQGAALRTGIEFALQRGAETIVTFDADGQHAADDIDRLVAAVACGEREVALGSRFLGRTVDLPPVRRRVLRMGVLFTRLVSRMRVTDTHNGLRAFSREAALRIRIRQNRMAHASEILDEIARHGLRYCEVPVTVRYSRETLAKGQTCWNVFQVTVPFLLGRLLP